MSYEEDIKSRTGTDSFKEDRLNIPILKYFWQASPISGARQKGIHKFLRKVAVLDNFSDYELRRFSQFLHVRNFHPGEKVFLEGSGGFGFYLILSGNVDISTSGVDESGASTQQLITTLSGGEYFGELALLEERSVRNATAQARGQVTLLAFFKPDLNELIERYPVVASKLLRSVSLIVSRRFKAVANELKILKERIKVLESESNEENK
ncbi:MAG: cyclic nucleotide-binding domain-containing protein [Bacteriovoracaceae bacterium]|nr:cyclic nucleotide-binding domain-containing protein [Bacteriovoracaceae bacterium]